MTRLEARSVRFYSKKDEEIFFSWLDNVKCVDNVFGKGRYIFIDVNEDDIDDDDFDNFIAIFIRYRIQMKQLSNIVPRKSLSWYKSPERLWYKGIFS